MDSLTCYFSGNTCMCNMCNLFIFGVPPLMAVCIVQNVNRCTYSYREFLYKGTDSGALFYAIKLLS
jgi:hypothetical protein